MARKTVMNLAVLLLLAISQVVHTATPRQLPPANPRVSLLVTSISGSGDSPSSGFTFSHGHGGAKEEKKLLDAPNIIPVPSSPPLQRKKSTLAASLLVTSVSGPSGDDVAIPHSSVEEKVLLDASSIPVPSSSPPLQVKKSMLASTRA